MLLFAPGTKLTTSQRLFYSILTQLTQLLVWVPFYGWGNGALKRLSICPVSKPAVWLQSLGRCLPPCSTNVFVRLLACKQQKWTLEKKYVYWREGASEIPRDWENSLGKQAATQGLRRPGHRKTIQDAAISASAAPHLLETTTEHHADPINCPTCSSFIAWCTGLGGRAHCQVLGTLLHIPGRGESESQTLWVS